MVLLLRAPHAEAVRAALAPAGESRRGSGLAVHAAGSALEALDHLLCPGTPPRLLILDEDAAGAAVPVLRTAAADPFGPTRLMLVPAAGPPPDRRSIMRALRPAAEPMPPPDDPALLGAELERGRVEVRFQPVVRIGDRRPVRVEALARWNGGSAAEASPLPPDRFVPAAERVGLGRALSVAVTRRALAGLAEARSRARTPPRRGVRLAVNLPLEVLQHPDLPAWLRVALRERNMRPRDLALELTETTPVRDRALLRRALRRLRVAGHAVLVDDLGLNEDRDWVMDLPFTEVKLDRALVEALPSSRYARAQVARIVRRAHAGGLSVTAEGVSSPRLWHAAAAAGADHAQGYAVGRPMPADVLADWALSWAGARRWPTPRRAAR